MAGNLEKLVKNSQMAIEQGVYKIRQQGEGNLSKSSHDLVDVINKNKHASLLTEIKFSSPSFGSIKELSSPIKIAKEMVGGGAVGLSVLTQPFLFDGSPEYFAQIRANVDAPLLMKDIIIDKEQIDAACALGADYVLLIQTLFEKKMLDNTVDDMIEYAHKRGVSVLLESTSKKEFFETLDTGADILGINNRDLDTLEINMDTTKNILEKIDKHTKKQKTIISESGIETPEHITNLRRYGAKAFLVGTSIMKSENIKVKVRELVMAI